MCSVIFHICLFSGFFVSPPGEHAEIKKKQFKNCCNFHTPHATCNPNFRFGCNVIWINWWLEKNKQLEKAMTKDDDEHTWSEFNRNIEEMNGKDKWQIILYVAYGVIPSYSALFSSFVIFLALLLHQRFLH